MKLLTTTFTIIYIVNQVDVSSGLGRHASFVPSHATKTKTITLKKNKSFKLHQNDSTIHPLLLRGGDTSLQSSLANDLVTTLVPKIGVLTSTLLYFSPFATVKRAQSDNALGTLNPIPLTIMAISSLCWLVYGLSIQDPYVTLSNVPGCIASIWYVVTILPLLEGETLKQTQGTVVLLSAVTINIWTWLSLTHKSMRQISSALGLYASFLFIILSGSPLSTIRTVVSTKNSKSILTQLTMAQVINTALWSLYGFAIGNRFVWGPNAVGLGFGLVQLLLKILFPAS
jgi:solute carrier family 50 protein (sugar transporter)